MDCPLDCPFNERTREHLLHHIKNQIPTKITYDEVWTLMPQRRDFLDPEVKSAFEAQVRENKPICFLPNSVDDFKLFSGGRGRSVFYVTGCLPCGSKTLIILDNIPVYFDLKVQGTVEKFKEHIRGLFYNARISYNGMEDKMFYPVKGFSKVPSPYIRLSFDNIQDRKKALERISTYNKTAAEPIQTASDDVGKQNYYYTMIARTHKFNTANWNRIEKYQVMESRALGIMGEKLVSNNCDYVFKVDLKDYVKLSKDRYGMLTRPGSIFANYITKDRIMNMQWDIETYRTVQNGQVPTPKDTDFTIFMMNSVFFWQFSTKSIFSVCCVDVDSDIKHDKEFTSVTVVCGHESNVLRANMEIWGKMAPDIMAAFNGSSFDWPLYREKLDRGGLLVDLHRCLSTMPAATGKYATTGESIKKYNFRSEDIKIDAENKHHCACVGCFPGVLDVDVLPMFLKLYTRMEVRKAASLNFFLAKNNIPSKEDMPYKKMFRIYERGLALKGVKSCHCDGLIDDNGTTHKDCLTCNAIVQDIDCKFIVKKEKEAGSSNDTIEYTNELHDDIKAKCCFCGKLPRNRRDMADVNFYCTVDCVRPQQLMVKRSIVADKRALSNMSAVPLFDSFYRADGMKVRNLAGKACHKKGLAFSNVPVRKSDSEKDHYPGAKVIPPKLGPERKRPVTGLDYGSLYPSLMETYNLTPDKIVETKEEADKLAAEGYSIHHITPFKYEKGEKKGMAANQHLVTEGWAVRHNGIYSSKDENIITKYTKQRKYTFNVDGKSQVYEYAVDDPLKEVIPHGVQALISSGAKYKREYSYKPVYGRKKLPGEEMGLFPRVLLGLAAKRKPLKSRFVAYSKILEKMELEHLTECEIPVDSGTELVDIDELRFRIAKIDAEQKAIKVLMNTFYGESGNFRSSLYMLLVAAGITCAGQRNLGFIEDYVTIRGFCVKYGDTDSLYLTCPDAVYADCDAKYAEDLKEIEYSTEQIVTEQEIAGQITTVDITAKKLKAKLAYWTTMVEITMVVMNNLKEEVGDYLMLDNGTLYLVMAYEEVGFPVVFSGKKKYFMIPHIETINFSPKDLFIRGIDIIKQGQAKISKKLGEEFMWEALSISFEGELIDIAIDKIHKLYAQYSGNIDDPAPFAMMGRYKPEKKNVAVKTFVARMRDQYKRFKDAGDHAMAALYEPPEPGDKFDYVLVQKEQRYTVSGTKIELKKGDYMEYVRVFTASQNSPNPQRINLSMYVKSYITGIFARFIAYHPQFEPKFEYDAYDKEQYKKADEARIDAATKYIERLCDSITGFDKNAQIQQGRDYRKVYHAANKQLLSDFARRNGSSMLVVQSIEVRNTEECSNSTNLINQIKDIARGSVTESDRQYGEDYVKAVTADGKVSIFVLFAMYCGAKGVNCAATKTRVCDAKEKQVIDRLYELSRDILRILHTYEKNYISLIEDMRKVKTEESITVDEKDLDFVNDLGKDKEILQEAYGLIIDLSSVESMRTKISGIVSAVRKYKGSLISDEVIPVDAKKESKEDAKRAAIIPDYTFM